MIYLHLDAAPLVDLFLLVGEMLVAAFLPRLCLTCAVFHDFPGLSRSSRVYRV